MYEETPPVEPENGVRKRVEKEIRTGIEPDPDPKRRCLEVSQLIEEGKLITIQNIEFWDQVLHEADKSKKLLMVYFTIPWDLQTPDRHELLSFLSKLASVYTDVIFVRADIFNVTDLKAVAEKWGVTGVPIFKFYKDGMILKKDLSGLYNYKERLKETVELISSSDPKFLDVVNPTPRTINLVSYDEDCWLDSGFCSTTKNQAYLFIGDRYMVVDYSNLNKLVEGPNRICKGLEYLRGNIYDDGVRCAFSSHDLNEAYLFSGALCVLINYVDRKVIVVEPYFKMFPFLTVSKLRGPDAAFESSGKYEAYMFFQDQYVRINYKQKVLLEDVKKITDRQSCFRFLSGTVFESGIDAAFTTHTTFDDGGRGNLVEAYIFKEGNFAVIRFTPGSTDGGYIVGDEPKRFIPDWPALVNVLPFKNCAFEEFDNDFYDDTDSNDDTDFNDDTDKNADTTDANCTGYTSPSSSESSVSSDSEAELETPRCGVNNDI